MSKKVVILTPEEYEDVMMLLRELDTVVRIGKKNEKRTALEMLVKRLRDTLSINE